MGSKHMGQASRTGSEIVVVDYIASKCLYRQLKFTAIEQSCATFMGSSLLMEVEIVVVVASRSRISYGDQNPRPLVMLCWCFRIQDFTHHHPKIRNPLLPVLKRVIGACLYSELRVFDLLGMNLLALCLPVCLQPTPQPMRIALRDYSRDGPQAC